MQHKKNVSITSLPPVLTNIGMSSTGSDDDIDYDLTKRRISINSNKLVNKASRGQQNQQQQQQQQQQQRSKKNHNWEVIEGYRDANRNSKINKPDNFEGLLLKRRMWPMRGWHKRYFILQDGILIYGKSKSDLLKNKLHGSIKIYLAMVSFLANSRRIHIDSSPQSIVCHLKAKSQYEFDAWIEHIKQHRLYHHYQITSNSIINTSLPSNDTMDSMSNRTIINRQIINESNIPNYRQQISSTTSSTIDTSPTHEVFNANNDIEDVDLYLKNIEECLENLCKSLSRQTTPTHNRNHSSDFLLGINSKVHVSKSNPNLINELISLQQQNQNQNQNQQGDPRVKKFYNEARNITEQLKQVHRHLVRKNEKLNATESAKNTFKNATRSQSILSNISLQDSQLQFYDAIENLTSESDTEPDDEDDSDLDDKQNLNSRNSKQIQPTKSLVIPEELLQQRILKRRRALPSPCPDTSQIGIFSILRKAIGKDLSKISLPVVLNEPLSILQRLSEELEYSELLDTANSLQDPFDRMVYVAAFIISGYSSSHYRNGCKNFNPLLGETYELIRPDKGWKYIAEQVSHHPPISTSNCQSKSFIHEQVFHAKIKFWGKSMEVHPNGYTRLTLPKYNETYQWNKIVMYIYNIMSKERRIEHCGEITVRCTNGVSCTITFPKSGYDRQKNEFFGDIIYENVVKRRVFGQWHEYFSYGQENTAKTIWRMSSMPEDASLYYGFTRFAIELNEITDDIRANLPPTDSRYRPDQRHLEEGRVELAEREKQRIEELQRSRRRLMESRNEHHKALWFNKTDDETNEYESNGLYWSKREQPGFAQLNDQFVELW